MTCQECVKLLLESSRDEIVHADSSELGRHLMTCARCRAVADSILGETTRVTGLFGAERSKRKGRRGAATTLGLVILALGVGAGLRHRARTSVDSPSPSVASHHAGSTVGTLTAPAVTPPVHEPLVARPIFVAPIEPSRPMVAEFHMPTTAPSDSQVSVSPPPGVSAAVIRTRDPKVTVVWLYQSSGDHP